MPVDDEARRGRLERDRLRRDRAFPGNLPHSYENADALATARGVSVVVFAKAGV